MYFKFLYSFMFLLQKLEVWISVLNNSFTCLTLERDWTARRRSWSLRFRSSNNARIVQDITDVIELENTSEDHSVSLPAQESITSVYGTPETLLNLSWKTLKPGDFMIIPYNWFQCFTILLSGTSSWHLNLSSLWNLKPLHLVIKTHMWNLYSGHTDFKVTHHNFYHLS